MSQAGMRALLDRAQSDESFLDRLLAAGSVEERRRLLLEAGYDVEPSDVPAFKEMVGLGELSDQDLERVAAAGTGTDVALGVGGTVTSAMIILAIALAVL